MDKKACQGLHHRWDVVAIGLLAVASSLYVSFRAVNVPLTNDEWGMLVSYIRPGLADLIAFLKPDAQQHFLLGLLAIPARLLLPIDEIYAIRIPSLIGFGIYLYSGIALTTSLGNPFLRVLALAGWIGNPFLLDFFSLARGYGLQVGLFGLSLQSLIVAYDPEVRDSARRVRSTLSLAAAALGVLANLSLLYVYLAILLLLLLRLYIFSESHNVQGKLDEVVRRAGPIVAVTALLGVFYLPRVIILAKYNLLYFGGTTGVFKDTLYSLVKATFYENLYPEALVLYMAAAISALFALNIVTFFRWGFPRPRESSKMRFISSPFVIVSSVSILAMLFIQVAHVFAGVKFVIERAALFAWPLIIGQFVFAINEIRPRLVKSVNAAMLVILLLPVLFNANSDHTCTWRINSNSKNIASELTRIAAHTPVVVGLSDHIKYTLWYYIERVPGFRENSATKDNPVIRQFGNLAVYSIDYGVPGQGAWNQHPQTTHYLLDSSHQTNSQSSQLLLLKEWTPSSIKLYRR